MKNDDLSAARGIINSIILSIILYALIYFGCL